MKLKQRLNRVLLVDDDEATNYIHSIIINQAECSKEVDTVMNGFEALDYLGTKKNGEYPRPEFIFLDINMPGMDGWQFLEEYGKLPEEQRGDNVIVLLTTSLNPEEHEKAKKIEIIEGFQDKPLSVEKVHQLMRVYFPENI